MARAKRLACDRPTDSVEVRAAAEQAQVQSWFRPAAAIRTSAKMCSQNTEGYDKQSFFCTCPV